MPETPENNHDNNDELDIFSRLKEAPRPKPKFQPPPKPEPEEPEEDFWASFAMITHTGDRFNIRVCFRSRQHYNAEMHKFEISKNAHVVLKDVNDESVVIKRDILLHVLPEGTEETPEKSRW